MDDAGHMRRVACRLDMSALSGGGHVVMSWGISDLGLEVDVKPPDPADTVDIEDLELNPQ